MRRRGMVEHSPKILASEGKAPITQRSGPLDRLISYSNACQQRYYSKCRLVSLVECNMITNDSGIGAKGTERQRGFTHLLLAHRGRGPQGWSVSFFVFFLFLLFLYVHFGTFSEVNDVETVQECLSRPKQWNEKRLKRNNHQGI